MMPKPLYCLCLVGLLCCLSQDVWAQEAYPMEGTGREIYSAPPVDGETGSHLRVTEPAEFADADTTGTRTRSAAAPSPSEAKQSDPASSDDSVLGFNFLYYIIQKFKMSDIVDK
ncbi:MAG TPA: hypothetical protein VKZ86_07530 [Cyclobacteriaceae bacterium]|nr:hypothetical protein [Cyclobacteriaceae bacterium]